MLEHLTTAERALGAMVAVLGLLGVVYGYLTRIKPKVGSVIDVWNALVELLFGKAEEPPNPITGAPAVPAVLGIGPRLTAQESTTALLVQNVALLTQQQASTDEVVRQLADVRHELGTIRERLGVLEEARAERVVAQAESAAMWSAIGAVQEHGQTTDPSGAEHETPAIEENPS